MIHPDDVVYAVFMFRCPTNLRLCFRRSSINTRAPLRFAIRRCLRQIRLIFCRRDLSLSREVIDASGIDRDTLFRFGDEEAVDEESCDGSGGDPLGVSLWIFSVRLLCLSFDSHSDPANILASSRSRCFELRFLCDAALTLLDFVIARWECFWSAHSRNMSALQGSTFANCCLALSSAPSVCICTWAVFSNWLVRSNKCSSSYVIHHHGKWLWYGTLVLVACNRVPDDHSRR